MGGPGDSPRAAEGLERLLPPGSSARPSSKTPSGAVHSGVWSREREDVCLPRRPPSWRSAPDHTHGS